VTSAQSPSLVQETLEVFVGAVMHYFDQITGLPARTETPYLLESRPEVIDYTAVIGISGDLKGCVYYTAPRSLLDRLLHFINETDSDDELRCDMVGEVANTLSGNARRRLGRGFMISVPVILQGHPDRILWPANTVCFVIPILWQETRSLLMICLATSPAAADD
jgi:chemotaxis protein CheX